MRQTSTFLQCYKIAAVKSHPIHLPEYQRSSCSPAVRSVKSFEFPSAPKRRKKRPRQLNFNTRHRSWNTWVIFRSPLPSHVGLGLQSFQWKYSRLNSGEGEGHIGVRTRVYKGVKSECKKIGENSRQMAPVSTICDEHCRVALPSLDATDRKETSCCLRGYFRSSLRRQDEKGILFLVKNKVKKYIVRQYQRRNTSAYCKKALKSFNFVSGKHPAAVRWPGWNIELPLGARLVSIRKLSWNVTCYASWSRVIRWVSISELMLS